MSRVFGLIMIGWAAFTLTGCVGPMGAGCCDSMGGIGSCGSCDSCSGCGELYVDPWINHPADCVDPCDSCGNYNGQSCGKCRSVFSGVRSLWGYRCGCPTGPIATTDRNFAPTCAYGCTGCDSCLAEPACGCEGACSCGTGFEPACGCEGACSCGTGFEPACGCEGACSCGTGFEPACGLEPACGCEGGCSCGAGSSVPYESAPGPYMIDSPEPVSMPVTQQPYAPQRTRKIFNPRPQTASRGFLNEYHR